MCIVSQFFINSEETTNTTDISDSLSQAASHSLQYDLESSLSQDLQKRNPEEWERSHPQFYLKIVKMGDIGKHVPPSFAPPVITATLIVNKAGTFGDHQPAILIGICKNSFIKMPFLTNQLSKIYVNNKQMFGNYCKKQLVLKKFL